jgi:hypothetical protein
MGGGGGGGGEGGRGGGVKGGERGGGVKGGCRLLWRILFAQAEACTGHCTRSLHSYCTVVMYKVRDIKIIASPHGI